MLIILYLAMSIDGYIADENGDVEWLEYANQDYNSTDFLTTADFLATIDVVVMGDITYKQVLGFGGLPYTGKYTYVFSREKSHQVIREGDNTIEFVSGQVKQIYDQMLAKHPASKVWLFGGADVIKQFYEQQLIDEYLLTVLPMRLGKGIRLPLGIVTEKNMQLIKEKKFEKDIAQKHYLAK